MQKPSLAPALCWTAGGEAAGEEAHLDLIRQVTSRVAEHCPGAYLVGGCVRDLLRGDPVKDLDVAVNDDPFRVGKSLADALRGHVFWLDQDEGVVRVILPHHERLQVDVCRLRGTLARDLSERDLTINALALPVGEVPETAGPAGAFDSGAITDLFGGREDLRRGVIRFVSPESPVRDPLRVLRALRFRWKLGFAFDPATRVLLETCVPRLASVSAERIRDEWFQLLMLPDPVPAVVECLHVGLAPWITGGAAGPMAGPAVRPEEECIELLAERLRCLLEWTAVAPVLLAEEPSQGRKRRELLLWTAVLQGIAPDCDVADACRGLALSSDERKIASKALGAGEMVRDLCRRWPVAGRDRLRLFQTAAPGEVEAVLLGVLALGRAPAPGELLQEALSHHSKPPEPLLTGQQIMEALDLRPGPQVGRWMRALEEARADGDVLTPDGAMLWLTQQAQTP